LTPRPAAQIGFLGLLAVVGILVLVAVVPSSARATTLERMDVGQLVERATMVVRGTVVAAAVEDTPGGVRTAVRVRVAESFKGRPSSLTTIYTPGGLLPDGTRVVVEAMPSFRIGEACYVFVDTRGWVVGGFQGKVGVADGRLSDGEPAASFDARIRQALDRHRAIASTSYVEGKVFDSTDKHMLAGVLVTCQRDGFPDFIRTATTDGAGYYRFDGLPVEDPHTGQNETYWFTFEKEGYETGRDWVWISAFGEWLGYGLYPSSTLPEDKPTITAITPGEASAGTDSHVLISGGHFGDARGEVEFSYGRQNVWRIAASDVSQWRDDRIICAVPTGIIDNYSASASTGPVVVTTASGVESNPYDFTVTFGYGGSKWANPNVTYYVNTSGVDAALRESLIDAGTAVWNSANTGFRFVDGGLTAAGFANDGRNVISWADGLPAGTLAWAQSYISGATVTQADIQFSNAYAWGTGTAGSGTRDIQTVGTHEVGHWLRLLDQYMSGDSAKVMYGYGALEEQKRSPTAGDLTGIQWIYPVRPPDTIGPVCSAKNATVVRGKTVTIIFQVHDAESDQVTMKVAITTKSGAVKKSWSRGYGENYSGWWGVKYKCTLPRGTYRIVVTGKDLAGNSASRVGRATLTVK
jgi:hypothetical protein